MRLSPQLPSHDHITSRKVTEMSRDTGDRYKCQKCGAQLVYEQGCPCPPEMEHSEICCGEQMKRVTEG